MDSRGTQQHLFSNQSSMSPIRRSAIFRTATIRPPSLDSPTPSGISDNSSAPGSSNGSDMCFINPSVTNGSTGNDASNFQGKNTVMMPNYQLDLDLDCGLFSNLESNKLFDYDPFANLTNDSADTYVESFRLNSGASEEDETMSLDESLFQINNLKSANNKTAKLESNPSNLVKISATHPRVKQNTKPTPAKTEARQGRRASTLVLADLERYYTQPLAEASKALGLSATMLKKVCRSFGIRRWPHRQLASIDRTITRVRQRLAVQERTHFYSLDGDCRASAALRNKVAQLEIKKDAICRLTSKGMSLHNVTKSKNPEKVILEELGESLDCKFQSQSNGDLMSNSNTSLPNSLQEKSDMQVTDRLESSNMQNSWDFGFNSCNDFSAPLNLNNNYQDQASGNIKRNNFDMNCQQRISSNIGATDPNKVIDDNLFLNFGDLNLAFQNPNDLFNSNPIDQASSVDGFLPTSSPWSTQEDPFNLFFPTDCNMGNNSTSEFLQSQGCLF